MAKHPTPITATDDEVRVLLNRYKCPVPFHEVRTRFAIGASGNRVPSGMLQRAREELTTRFLPATTIEQ